MPLRFAEPCQACGRLYLEGSASLCKRCQRSGTGRQRFPRLRCACGRLAQVVVLVTLGDEESLNEERLALCRDCLVAEQELQAWLDRAGYSHATIRERRNRAGG